MIREILFCYAKLQLVLSYSSRFAIKHLNESAKQTALMQTTLMICLKSDVTMYKSLSLPLSTCLSLSLALSLSLSIHHCSSRNTNCCVIESCMQCSLLRNKTLQLAFCNPIPAVRFTLLDNEDSNNESYVTFIVERKAILSA